MSVYSIASKLFCVFAAAGLAFGSVHAEDMQLRVYRPDGSVQCDTGSGRSLAEDQKDLESLGANVISSEKKTLPFRVPARCGAMTNNANTYVISESDWRKIKRGFVGPSKFGRWIFDSKTVVVYMLDDTVFCGGGKEISLEAMAKVLTNAGINIVSQRKSTDGLMHMAVCGGITGSVNTYEILSSDLDKALDMGFRYFITSDTSKMILDQDTPPAAEMNLTSNAKAGGWPLPWPFPW
jgi:hypothetical protein